jgi:hypothetical protein
LPEQAEYNVIECNQERSELLPKREIFECKIGTAATEANKHAEPEEE